MHFSPEKCGGGSLSLIFPAVPARVRPASDEVSFSQPNKQTHKNHMAHKLNTKTARLDLDITPESQRRFVTLHKSLGFKTRTETFEALVFSVSAKEVLQSNVIERIESKLNQTLEILESLT